MRFIYTFLFYLALPLVLLRLLWRSRRLPAYRDRWLERFGYVAPLDNCIWVHAVSVGETIAAVPFIKALKKRYPTIPIVVTNMTPTGAARVKASLGDVVIQYYIPYDLPDAVARFLKSINPKILIVMETELWPNLFAGCRKRHIPIIIANARLSEKSATGYARILPLVQEMFLAITQLAAQSSTDAERFIALGLPSAKITITGSMKFDLEIPTDLNEKTAELLKHLGHERFIWIAASTHPGEEEIILAAHRLIHQKNPNALLILVPRHPDRFDTVASMAAEQGFRVARRSLAEACTAETDVYLGDTMGELLVMYAAAQVAFVGGSFAEIGGHNMLEPAFLQKPILTGPVLFNFEHISQLLITSEGMMVVRNATELTEKILYFFQHPDRCARAGQNSYSVIEKNRGALQRQLELINL